MKIIDEKGRLFGKINLIDFLVILLLVCILPAFYLGYKIITKKHHVVTTVQEKEFIEIEINCQLIKLKPEIVTMISIGDRELDEAGQVIGGIVDLGQRTPYKYEFNIGKEQKIIKEDTRLEQIEAKLKLNAEIRGDGLYYKDKLLKINSPFEFKTDKYSLTAIPLEEEKKEEEKEEEKEEFTNIEIRCKLIKLKPETLKLIKIGDRELDKSGQVISEILSLGKIEPYLYEFNIGKEQKIIKEDTRLEQIEAKLKLNAEIRGDGLYYKDKLLKINSPFEFKADKYIVEAIPVKIEIKKIEIYVMLKNLDDTVLKQISVGDREVDKNGEVIAEILSLGKVENNTYEFNLGAGNFIKGEDPDKKQVSVKMRLKFQVKQQEEGERLYFKDKEIKYNMPFEFKTDKYKIEGVMTKTFEVVSPIKKKWISLQVNFTAMVPEIANIIQSEDIERDANGAIVAKIQTVISNKPSQVLVLKENRFIPLNHLFTRDVVVNLDVRCIEKEGVYYFKNYPVKMGNNITFSTDLYSISGLITGINIK